ncbi:hypothetical protein PTKIN_Ptkin12aG0218600 [Pterospermum kingtungense]
MAMKIVEQCQVCAPPISVPPVNSLIPLTLFDLPWLFSPPAQPLYFYPYPYPASHFLSSTLPALKRSLSLTLQFFFPFAGRLVIFHSNSTYPHPHLNIAYNQNASSVSFTVAESNADFYHVCGNHPRHVKELHPLVPWLSSDADECYTQLHLLAVKVTLFPNFGLCIGLAYHHVAADGRTFDNFIKTWASFHRDSSFSIKSMAMPSHDRSVVVDKHGLEAIFLNEYWRKKKCEKQMVLGTQSKLAYDDMVRATFVMGLTDLENIKSWIIAECKNKKLSEPVHLSPYVVACAFIWVCFMKSLTHEASANEIFDNIHPCYFGFNAGGLNRFDYPVPVTYFGNCVGFGRSEATRGELLGENGMIFAAKAIGETIKKLDKALVGEGERWISEWEVLWGSDMHIIVVGSPKLDVYETDFGWGRPMKVEEISIDHGWGPISLTQSRDEAGGIEVGLSLPNPQMDAFTSFFARALTLNHANNACL